MASPGIARSAGSLPFAEGAEARVVRQLDAKDVPQQLYQLGAANVASGPLTVCAGDVGEVPQDVAGAPAGPLHGQAADEVALRVRAREPVAHDEIDLR